MAISAFLSHPSQGLVSVMDDGWPNLPAFLPLMERAAEALATERTAFAAMLTAIDRRSAELLPQRELTWVQRVVRARKSSGDFWERHANGEQLAVILRKLVQERGGQGEDREVLVEVADALIEIGVKGAAHFQQALVRPTTPEHPK
ncbi:hypothetical protein [Sphingobium sp. B2]|uniref:hypothetical protein n=1 Tax=Sphingobium sp. B2 TaxID=2583228 RepID=UPI00119D1BFE|nr:hypothetical protein [Sphingobium sp. B2]